MSISRFDLQGQLDKDIRRQTGKPALLSQRPIGPPGSGPALASSPGGGGGALMPQTGPPAPPAQRTSGATSPASAGSRNGGAGTTTPMQMLESSDPESVIKSAEVAARTTSKSGATDDIEADAKKQKINESMAAQGMDPVQAYKELKDQYLTSLESKYQAGQIEKKHYTKLKDRWKNIFNIIPKEDFGLFLMDFGLRLTAASAENSFAGAFGQAGLGALQGSQERQRFEQAGALNRDQMAHERAMDTTKLEMEGRKTSALERYYERGSAPQPTATDQGLTYWNPETKQWEFVKDPETGERVYQDFASRGGYNGRDAWLMEIGQRAGYDEQELLPMLLGADPPEERRQKFRELVLKMKGDSSYVDIDPIIGKRYKDFTREDINAWVEAMMQDESSASERARRGRIGGGGGRGSGPPPDATPEERAQWYLDHPDG